MDAVNAPERALREERRDQQIAAAAAAAATVVALEVFDDATEGITLSSEAKTCAASSVWVGGGMPAPDQGSLGAWGCCRHWEGCRAVERPWLSTAAASEAFSGRSGDLLVNHPPESALGGVDRVHCGGGCDGGPCLDKGLGALR
jgi:hypothetical protein